MKFTPICQTVDVVTDGSDGTISATGGRGGNGGKGGDRAGKGSGNGGTGGSAGNGGNGGAITIESDGAQTYSGTLLAVAGSAGTAGGGGARTSSSGTGSTGGAGSAGSSGSDGSIHLTTSGATITTTLADIDPTPVTNMGASAFCAATTATLTVNKTVVPSGDSGKFNLTIDGVVKATDQGNGGTTGAVTVTAGVEHTVDETAGTGTSLGDYTKTFSGDCDSSGKITIVAGASKTCTITNTKVAKLTVTKTLVPSGDSGKFNLTIDGVVKATDQGNNGTTGAVVVTTGVEHTVGETAGTGTSLGDYTTTFGGDCDSSGKITLAAGDDKTCTITNTKVATLTVTKTLVPAGDSGKFNLQIDGVTKATDQGNGGTTGAVVVTTGVEHTVGETAGTGTSLVGYVVTFGGDCNSSGKITLAAGDNKTCTITNTKVVNPSGTAKLWVELKNSDDIGTNFDVIVKLLRNGSEIASGVALCQTGIARGSEKEVDVPLTVTGSGSTSSGDVLAVQVFARIGTTDGTTFCGGHGNAVGLRLHYDGLSVPSQAADQYLHSDGTACGPGESTGVTNRFLDGTAPTTTSDKCQDSAGVNFAGGNVPQQIGGPGANWTKTVP